MTPWAARLSAGTAGASPESARDPRDARGRPVRGRASATPAEPRHPPHGQDAPIARLLRPDSAHPDRLRLARLLALDPHGVFAVVQLEPAQAGAMAHALARGAGSALRAPGIHCETFAPTVGGAVGFLLYGAERDPAPMRERIGALRATLVARLPGILGAASVPALGLRELPAALAQVRYALALLQAGLVRGPFADWAVGADLGPYRPLYPLWGAPTTGEFVREMLGDQRGRDAQQVAGVVRTVLAYARHGGQIGDAAAELGVHRNTVTYRLRLIERWTGRSPRDPAQLPSLSLAALLWTLPAPLAPAMAPHTG